MLRAACNYCFCAMKTYMHMHAKCGQTCSHSLLKFDFFVLFFFFFCCYGVREHDHSSSTVLCPVHPCMGSFFFGHL